MDRASPCCVRDIVSRTQQGGLDALIWSYYSTLDSGKRRERTPPGPNAYFGHPKIQILRVKSFLSFRENGAVSQFNLYVGMHLLNIKCSG